MDITYTQTSYIKSCPKKYYFRYIMLLVPKKKDEPLLRGTAIHEGFEAFFHGKRLEDILKGLVDQYDKAISNATEEDREDWVIGKHTVYGMFKYYPFENLSFQQIVPEEKFSVRINGLRGIRLIGKVDGRIQKDNLWWLREVKTTGSTFEQAENRASVSYQASGYLYGMHRALGLTFHGVLYDILRVSQLRKRVSETAEEFGERIVDDYKNHMLDTKSGNPCPESRLYKRYWSYRSPHQLAEYEHDIAKAAKMIRDCRRKNEWMRNPDVCYFFNKECPYKKICWLPRLDEGMLKAYYDKEEKENPEI